jgi:replicative DNA helicase
MIDFAQMLEPNGIPFTWGTTELDKTLSPIERNHMILFAGEQGSGKTAYTLDMAIRNAKLGHRVVYVTLEMTRKQMLTRVARSYAGITPEEWRTKNIPECKKDPFIRKGNELSAINNLQIVGTEMVMATCEELGAMVRTAEADLMIIDNLDLINRESGEDEISGDMRITKFFMEFTSEYNIPVLLVHHFNKMGKIRGSQKIVDNADMVMFGSRDKDPDACREAKARFSIVQGKDREFGNFASVNIYFRSGSFYDSLEDLKTNEVKQLFS